MASTVNQTVTPAEALWALYQAQSKRVKNAFLRKLREDRGVDESINAKSFMAVARQVRKEYNEGKGVTLSTPEEIEAYLDSL